MIERFIGIDFSGAERAGDAIWIAEARMDGEPVRIERCRPASALPGSGRRREECLPALVDFIAQQRQAVIGCDFPFSLPAAMIAERDWRGFVLNFGDRFAQPEAFLADCRKRGRGRELKRAGDRDARVPFSPYNLRIFRQTFHGIRDLLAPLIRRGHAVVLPMARAKDSLPWVVETCPASTLKSLGLYHSYKGQGGTARNGRRRILRGLVDRSFMEQLPAALRRLAIDNSGGDALDSMIAAAATARAFGRGALGGTPRDAIEGIEGRVYY